jgi:hypothetical protein
MNGLINDLQTFKHSSREFTFYSLLQETRPSELDTSLDALNAMIATKYYYLQHHARFRYLHEIGHSHRDTEQFFHIEGLTAQCFQAAWKSFDIFNEMMSVGELIVPNLVCLLPKYEPPPSSL